MARLPQSMMLNWQGLHGQITTKYDAELAGPAWPDYHKV